MPTLPTDNPAGRTGYGATFGTTALLPGLDGDTTIAAAGCAATAIGTISVTSSFGPLAALLGLSRTTNPPLALKWLFVLSLLAVLALSWRHRRYTGTATDTAKRFAAYWAAYVAGTVAATAVLTRMLSVDLLPAAAAAVALMTAAGAHLTAEHLWRIPPEQLHNRARAGEIWWAAVQFEESRQSKDRPCLVLTAGKRNMRVLMFTSKDRTARGGYVPVPPGMWRDHRQSYLRTDRVIRVRAERLRRQERTQVPQSVLDAARKAAPAVADF